MMKINPHNFLFVLTILVFTSCTVKKRAYRSGYYVEWNKHTSHGSTASQTKLKQPSQNNHHTEIVNTTEETDALVSTEKIILLPEKTKRPNLFVKDDCGDLITMKSGDEIKAKVIEISDKQIKYKRCDNLDGPLITVNKSEVFMIKYANGSKEIIKDEKPANPTTQKPTYQNNAPQSDRPPRVHPMAVASVLCSLFGWLIGVGPIVGLIMGIQALREINAQPTRYTGKGFAIAGIVLGALYVLIILLVVLLLFGII